MAASLPRLVGRTGHSLTALRGAARATTLGRITAEEEAWLSRIDAWRDALGSERRVAELLHVAGTHPGGPEHPPHHLASALPWWSVPRIWGRFLMRFVRQLGPRSGLELGTGFGISGAYQAAALELTGVGRLTTMDVAGEWAAIAERGFSELGLAGRVELRRGSIDETLDSVLRDVSPIDYAFLDADHTREATIKHFDAVLPALAPGAAVVVDDILWSDEMRRAWDTIKARQGVSAAVHLGRMGVVVTAGR